MDKVVIYKHEAMHWVYAALSTVLMWGIVFLNNQYGHPSWVFDLTIVLIWFIGASRAALYWIRDDRFVGNSDDAIRWIKERDLEEFSDRNRQRKA